MVQLCVADDRGLDHFKQTLRSIARDEHIDGSLETTRDLNAIGATGKNIHTDGTLVNVGVESDSGPSLTAGNLGLNAYDIAVGFARGHDSNAASAFSNRVVARLGKRWAIRTVPKDSGAVPNPECSSVPKQ